MKKTIGILIALALVCISALALADVAVDAAHFPDDNFRDYVSDEFDKDGNGSLSGAEIAAAETIDCHGKGIENLQGIEYFTAAKELLCYSNSLKTLNVSSNKALVYLNCWDNQLTALNVSALTELEDLRCSKNQFTSLNLSSNTKLKELRAYEGKLVSLNLSGCTLLEYVEVNQNAISSLTFGSHPALNYLDVWAIKLTSLNVTGFPKLKFLRCTDNQISSLDTSANTNLQELICYQNPITTLDVSKNRKLIKLDLAETPTLKSLSVANNPNLMELWVYDTALTTLDISNCRYMSEVYKTDPEEINGGAVLNYHDDSIHACLVVDKTLKIISNPTGIALDAANFPDAVFRQAVSAFDTDKNGALSTGEIKQVTKFSCSGKGIKSLEGIENLSALTNLDCSSNNLKKLDVSGNLNLVTLNCSNNKISDLELEVDDIAEIGLQMADGMTGSLHLDYFRRPVNNSLEVSGTEGCLYCDNLNGIVTLSGADGSGATWTLSPFFPWVAFFPSSFPDLSGFFFLPVSGIPMKWGRC